MTQFTNCALTDPLEAHDVYRLTIKPVPAGLFSLTVTSGALSTALQEAMAALYAAGSIDNVTTFVTPLLPNPYADGDLAEVVDCLVESAGGAVSDLLQNVLNVLNGVTSFFTLTGAFTSTGETAMVIGACERVVGQDAVTPGTPDANTAVYSATAAATRASEAQAAGVTVAASTWLSSLESDLGAAGKYVIVGATALALYYVIRKAKQIRRVVA